MNLDPNTEILLNTAATYGKNAIMYWDDIELRKIFNNANLISMGSAFINELFSKLEK